MIDFSDEEGYGKFLDLHEVYDMYINLKQMEVGCVTQSYLPDDYMQWLLSYDCINLFDRKWTTSPMCKPLTSCLSSQKTRRTRNTNGIS